MIGFKIHAITEKWEYIDYFRSKAVPRRGELIHLGGEYKTVLNVVYQPTFWGTKIFVITEPLTINVIPEEKEI